MQERRAGKFYRIISFLLFASFFGFAMQQAMDLRNAPPVAAAPPDSNLTPKPVTGDTVYKNTIARADQFFKENRFEECLSELNKALRIKPKDPALKGRIIQVQGLIAQEKKNNEDFARLMASGDNYYGAKAYLDAKQSYQMALNIKPDNEDAKKKLNETLTLLRSQKAQNILYDVAIASANKFFEAGDYDKAVTEYQNASKIMPDQMYPKDKINEILKIKVDKQVREELYAQAIIKADNLYNAKKYPGALTEYQNALKQKPDEVYPKQRIEELQGLLNQQKALDESYQKAIAQADLQFNAKQYPDARLTYGEALKIKPGELYPKNRIAEIDRLLAGLKKADQDYQAYIALADSFYISKNFMRARQNYQLALQVKPQEAYPKEMLSKTESGMSRQELDQKSVDEANAAALARQKQLDDQYAGLIADADRLFTAKSYDQSEKAYQDALGVKPSEKYPADQIEKIARIREELARQKSLDDQYTVTIAKADQLYTDKSWEDSRSAYQEASGLKPSEAYPKTRISEIDRILGDLAQQKAAGEQYQADIASADKLFTEKNWDQARMKYAAASAIKPTEQYPKTKIAEIDGILGDLAKQKALQDQYASLIAKADQELAAKSYDQAVSQYTQALLLKPDEQYPKDKLAEIDGIKAGLARQKDLDDRYKAFLADADKLFAAKSYDEARKGYQDALGLKPAEKYPQDRIAQIDQILGEISQQKAIDEQYASAVAKADKLFADKSWPEARTEYQAASGLKPGEAYPKTKIAEIDGILGDLAKQKAIDDQYQADVTEADKLFAEKSWDQARTKYSAASAVKPAEQYPKTKIAEIDGILGDLAKQKALDDQYAAVIAKADQQLAAKSFDQAVTLYTQALSLKPDEQYPKDKLTEIEGIRSDLARQKDLDDRYNTSLANADKLFAAKSYEEARKGYQGALSLKPSEKYPQDRVSQIDQILGDIAKQKALDEQYAASVTKADQLFVQKLWTDSRAEYQAASVMKPAETYPKTKISEIDGILGDMAKQKAIDDQYQSAVTEADNLFAQKNWDPARAKYEAASAIKPAEQYPKTKITEIDGILADIAKKKALDDQYSGLIAKADQLLAAKSLDEAATSYTQALNLKPGEQYPKDKLAEIDGIKAEMLKQKDLEERFNATLANAQKLFGMKSWEAARAEYVKASDLKPDEQAPKGKIAEIDAILAGIAKQKALDEQYQAFISSGDKLFASKDYIQAKDQYSQASGLKPEEQYPKTKIAAIEGILADLEKQKALDDAYAAAVAAGDKLFTAGSFEESKTEYTKASGLKPGEAYPKTKLAEADKQLTDLARRKAIDDQYNTAIGNADKLLADKTYDQAKSAYQNAAKIKPSEQYPQDKIREIDAAVAEIARQKNIDDRYKAQLAKADQSFTGKQYEQSKTEYNLALAIKPAEQYPKDRINEIDQTLAQMKATDDAYKTSISKADQLLTAKSYEEARAEYQNAGTIKPAETYPKDKISEINNILTELKGKQATYDNLIRSADDLLSGKEYVKSKDLYQQAQGIFPAEAYPKERIAFITRTVDSIYRVNKADYDRAVGTGDKFFNSFEFDKAIDAYTEAIGYLPMESYPKEQIAKIRKTIAENAIVDVLKTPVVIRGGDEKKFTFTPVGIAARKNNFVYLRIKNLSGKPFNILMRYGVDAQSNGGVVIRNVSTDGLLNERLISVRDQDLWYRADNNWISLYPQGGDIEVSFIQISKSN
jgi:tetratricopeptide (TPR) repeat protein